MSSHGNKRYFIPLVFLSFVIWCLFSVSFNTPSLESTKSIQQSFARENAAFVVLARNSDRKGIREAMQQLEDRFNHKYHYPYVFLNEEPFDQEFIDYTSGLASGETHYGLVKKSMWGYPDWINKHKAKQARKKMGEKDIIYGDVESYHHMCRFQSGFFFRHPLLEKYDYYWRVEPDVRFTCDIDYDPFKMMRDRDLKYGFTISIIEYEETIPTLWETTKRFIERYPDYVIPFNSSDSLIDFISYDKGETYNLCHFWSNFEIGSLEFLRSKEYLAYFDFLDKAGGFFYERWGDAPVHSIAVALFLKKSEVHYFYDIGYFHDPITHCPSEPAWLPTEKCSCEPNETIELQEDFSCHIEFLKANNKTVRDYVVTER